MGAIYAGFHEFQITGIRSPAYDKDMASSEAPLKSKALDEIVLWTIVALLLALAIAWAI